MTLTPTFGFKGIVLPVLDKQNNLLIFFKNECEKRILLNVVSLLTNEFININKNSTTTVNCGPFTDNLQIKVFYMGNELFSFCAGDLDQNVLLSYSDYIIKNNLDSNKVSFSISLLEGCKIFSSSINTQPLFIKFVNRDTNEIICEDTFTSGEPYHLNETEYINYEISIFNSEGLQVFFYRLDLFGKTVLFDFQSYNKYEILEILPTLESFKNLHCCDVICSTNFTEDFLDRYPHLKFVSDNQKIENVFAIYKIKKSTKKSK